MDLISQLKLHGSMEAVLIKEDGEVQVTRKDNIIVDAGFDLVCDCLSKATSRPAVANVIAVGTGAAAAVAGDTLLEAEIARAVAAYAHTAGTKTFTLTYTFAAGTATGAITEAGIFNSATANAGSMLDRVVFAVINKGTGDTLKVTFTFTLS